jgi:hypothetical protein
MSDIDEAKRRLPLPDLMARVGLGEHATKSAKCPFHYDRHNSFSVWQAEDGHHCFKCHARCGQGDEINFLQLYRGLSPGDATKLFLEMAGVSDLRPVKAKPPAARSATSDKPPQPFDWQVCVDAFTDKHVEQVAKWRGFSPEFVRELRDGGHIGIFRAVVAFPIHNGSEIVGCHYRKKGGKDWYYHPKGIKAAPMVFGELRAGENVQVFESTWDGLDYLEKSGKRDGVFITRGATNARFVAEWVPNNCPLYLWTQNDEPGAKWERDIVKGAKCEVKRCKIPAPHKDLNDWTGAGATSADLPAAIANGETLREPEHAEEGPRVEQEPERVELPPPPARYVPPPLELLPSQLQKYIHAAAKSLNVDLAFILLPLLSWLGTAIGKARSILLKRGFIQPPVIWTAIIGRSGSRKSPSLDLGCGILEHERELIRRNRDAQTEYQEHHAEWEAKTKPRGAKPQLPDPVTCVMDKLTFEALARALPNSTSLLIKKDELSHWFESMDQYHGAKGADVGQWVSLHTAVLFAFDRSTDKRSDRVWQPRVCITGGIQPKVLRRLLTEDFFDRGLPARFLFAHPPFIQDRWTEATVPDDLRDAVLKLFEKLWLLQPEDKDGRCDPKLLTLDEDAKAIFVEFYDECGAASTEAREQEEAAWCKLAGYATRLALVGQLARDPNAQIVNGEVMQAACDLARWSGREAVRIYATLVETQEQREARELCEFVERRGGAVYEREVMQSFTRLKNDKLGVERELTALVKAERGKWEPVEHGGGPGRPTRKFRLFMLSTSTQFSNSRGKTGNSVDVDDPNSQKITPISNPVCGEVDAMPASHFEL